MLPEHSIFISYRRSDSIYATERIYDQLTSHYGSRSVFKDVDSIPYGADFREHIRHWISRCQVLLAVIGPTWLTVTSDGKQRLDNPEDWVRTEIEAALAQKIVVIPLLIDHAPMPDVKKLPDSLQAISYYNRAQVRPNPDFHHDVKRLIQNLDRILDQSEKGSETALKPKNNKSISLRQNSRFLPIKANELKKRISALLDDYEALSSQLSYTINAAEKNNLNRQKDFLEKEIEELEVELKTVQVDNEVNPMA